MHDKQLWNLSNDMHCSTPLQNLKIAIYLTFSLISSLSCSLVCSISSSFTSFYMFLCTFIIRDWNFPIFSISLNIISSSKWYTVSLTCSFSWCCKIREQYIKNSFLNSLTLSKSSQNCEIILSSAPQTPKNCSFFYSSHWLLVQFYPVIVTPQNNYIPHLVNHHIFEILTSSCCINTLFKCVLITL